MPITVDIHVEIALELSRLQREAIERARQRAASQQLGEAWVGLPGYENSEEASPLPR